MLPLAGLVARAIIGGVAAASAPVIGVGVTAAAAAGIAGHTIAKMLKDVDNVANNETYNAKEKDSKILDIVLENVSDEIKNSLYTVETVSSMINVSTESIRRKIRSGEIKVTEELNSRKDGYRLSFTQVVELSRMFGKEDRLSAYIMGIMANTTSRNEENMDDEDNNDDKTEYKMSNEVMTNYNTAEDDEMRNLEKEMLATNLQVCQNELELINIQLSQETDLQEIIALQKKKASLLKEMINIKKQINGLK